MMQSSGRLSFFLFSRLCSPPPSPTCLGAFLTHTIHTYVIDTGWEGGGVGGREFLKEQTAVVLGVIEHFSALFQKQTTGLLESD